MGIVSASDANQTADAVSDASQDDSVSVDQANYKEIVNDTLSVSNDKHIAGDVLAANDVDDISGDAIVKEGKQVSKDEVLSASNSDKLGGVYTDESYAGSTAANLNSLLTGHPSDDIILTKDYLRAADYNAAGIVVKNPSITGNLGRTGAPVTLNGNSNLNNRIFQIAEGTQITISNIIFMNTESNEGPTRYGGAIRVRANANVTFINCTFYDDSQCEAGGAVYFEDGASGHFINCTVERNYLRHSHWDSVLGGTAIYFTKADGIDFINCSFDSNYGDAYSNGAVYIGSGSSNVNFENCDFNNNTVRTGSSNANTNEGKSKLKYGKGAAIFFDESVTNVTITNCGFTNNNADHYGGAVYVSTGCKNITVESCYFENNTVRFEESSTRISARETVYYNVGNGGGLYFEGGCDDVNIINTTFENNYCPNYGGGLYFNGTINNLLINGSTFIDNYAKNYDGGGLYIPDGNTATVDNSTFRNNSAGRNGGAVFWGSQSDFATTGSTFEGNRAQDGSTVYFNKSVEKITIKDTKYINNKNTGAGTVGSALKIDLMDGYVKTLEIINCSFIGNDVLTDGAAVYVPNTVENVHVINCSFENNSAYQGKGAAIYLDNDGELILLNTTFVNNVAKQGATVYLNNALPKIVVNDTQFINNTVTDDNGAGLYIKDNSGDVEFNNCSFIGNNASGKGGGLYIPANLGSLKITNTTLFVNNIAGGEGGAIYWGINEDFTVENYTFINNTASEGSTVFFVNNLNNIVFNNTKFINNTVTNGNGGALYIPDGSTGNVLLNNCTFDGNNASGDGGAIYVPSTIGSITLNETDRFVDNTAGDFGGAIYWGTTIELNINNYTFIGNSAENAGTVYYPYALANKEFSNITFINNTASNNGGALYIVAGSHDITVLDCNFTGNDATSGNGGGIYFNSNCYNIIVENNTFDNNSAGSGGAIHFYAGNSQTGYSTINILNSNFTNNKATKTDNFGGSAIGFNKVSNVDIDNCIFDSNVATSNGALMFDGFNNILFSQCNFTNNNATAGSAGAVFLNNPIGAGNTSFIECVFDSNTASGSRYSTGYPVIELGNGGAIYLTGSNHKFIDNNFTNNHVNGESRSGGAIYSTANNIEIVNNNFINNSAYSWGGAIMNAKGTKGLNITNSSFINNHAWNAGAVDVYGTNFTNIINCSFENNTANITGGALWMDSYMGLIENCNFTNNKATNASAISYTPADTSSVGHTQANITNCRFFSNNASGTSTVWFESSKGRMENCNFTDNVANIAGGVYVNIGEVTVTNTNFTSNKARDTAGAIYATSKANTTTIEYSNFINNSAANYAGAIYTSSQGDMIQFCNFINNTASDGGAIVLNNNNQKVLNSLFVGNNATIGKGGAILITTPHTQTIENSTFKNNYAFDGGAIYNPGVASASVTIKNDTFINNTAKYNGGALFIGINGVYYRDYNNFGNASVSIDSQTGRLSWSPNGENVIIDSLFEDNLDYLFEVDVWSQGTTAIVYVTVPEYYNRNNFNLKVVITNSSGGEVTYEYPNGMWNVENIPISLTLADQIEDDYNITVTFSDENLLTKEINDNFTIFDDKTGPFTRLQNKINDAILNNVGIVEIETDVIYSEEYDNGQINITDSITIVGKSGVMINAKNFSRIFYINASNVTIKNLIFVGGNADGRNTTISDRINGGAILWEGENGTIENCNFTNNTAFNGGAVFVQNNGSQSKIIGTVFEHNIASNNGGAIDLNATGGNVTGSTFYNNTANNGGAIFVGSNSTHSYLINSTFNKNHADERGGAVDWYASSGDIENSTFRFNDAQYGGAVFVGQKSGDGNITNSTFFKNTASVNGGAVDWNATGGHIIDSRFYNNTASENGGAVFVGANGTSGNITNSVFENNSANRGGAVDWYATSGNIVKSNFTNNRADENGGAVFIGTQSKNTNITYSTFILNGAGENGGAVDWNASMGNLSYSVFESNSAKFGAAVFVGSNATGGIIYNSSFSSNEAEFNGGAVDWNASSGTITLSYFYENMALKGNGGAVFVGSNSTTSHIYNSVFEKNHADKGHGGAVDWYASTGDIEYSNFTENTAKYGGAVFVGHATNGGNITFSRFENNTASENGGAVDWNATHGQIANSTFKYNVAEADGGAIFVGSNSTNGKIFNSTFINNKAIENGGAVDWNASGGNITLSTFENNVVINGNGGAVFVGANSTTTYIVRSNFTGNNASAGRGGAIDWYASAGHVEYSNFTRNHAVNGGAIFVGTKSDGGKIISSIFVNNTADENGGAVDWNATNGNLTDSSFEENSATYGGAVFVGGNTTNSYILNSNFTKNNATRGGAVDWNASSGEINNSRFDENTATDGAAVFVGSGAESANITYSNFTKNIADGKGGAIYFNNIADGDIINAIFSQNSALNGGAIYVEKSDEMNISHAKFNQNMADVHGADIYIDESNDGLLYNLTVTNSVGDDSIYVNGNNTLENITSDGIIVFNEGKSSLVNSNLSAENAVMINKDANVTLSKNTISSEGVYAVYNNGILTLSDNSFESVIINNGTILSKTYTVIMDNSSVTIKIGDDAVLNATIVDDTKKNTIVSVSSFKFVATSSDNDYEVPSTNNGTHQTAKLVKPAQGLYVISVNDDGLKDNDVRNATLHVKNETSMTVDVVEQIREGDKVVINATINSKLVVGNVTFMVNGEEHQGKINNGIASIVLYNLSATYYTVTATFEGDDMHFGCEAQTTFNVNFRDPAFRVDVANILNGQNATVIVTTNASGTVLLIVNGKDKEVEIRDGRAEWNVSGLAVGTYNVTAKYFGNDRFNRANNYTLFNVSEMSVHVNDTELGVPATIVITIPEGISDGLNVFVDDVDYTSSVQYNNGNATVTTSDGLALGPHTVNVTYTGAAYPYYEINGSEFRVTASSNYLFNVTITEAEYGKNTTITVETEPGIDEVNLTIDGVEYTIEIDPETGKGQYNISNLTAGNHTVVVSFEGNDTLAFKEYREEIEIPKANSELIVSFDNNGPGEDLTVTVDVGPGAEGMAVVIINDEKYPVEVDENGKAVVTIPNANPGNYSVTAKFYGDDNYNVIESGEPTNFTVDRFSSQLTIGEFTVLDNNTVIVPVTVNHNDADGTVNITINGKNYTAEVINGTANVVIGDLGIDNSTAFNVTYSGNKFYSNATVMSTENITVGKLNNFTVDVNITAGKYGENTIVTVNITEGWDGDVAVLFDGDEYPVDYDEDIGMYIAVIPPSDLGPHTVQVKVENSSVYKDRLVEKSFSVERNDEYDVIVNVTERNYGENTTIEITAPKEIGILNITIDGVNYTVTINETTGKGVFNISNLTAGKHEVVTSFPGDEYFGPVSTTNVIDVPKAESEMLIDISGGEPGEDLTVTVDVGPNADGIVVITINNETHYVETDDEGKATFTIENADPGQYNISATFKGDDNYQTADSMDYNITVSKFNATMDVDVKVGDRNNVTVIVTMNPADATGDVTVSLANGTDITFPIVDGVAEIPVGVLPVNGTMAYNITYSGDERYNNRTDVADENITVGKLNNLTVEIDIVPGQFGEETIVTVDVPDGIKGDIAVFVDGVEYHVDYDEDTGKHVAVIPPVDVGSHNVTVKFENSSHYNDTEFNTTFDVDKNDHFDVNIKVTPQPPVFGQNTTIEVEIPEGLNNVTVIVDGHEIFVPVNSTTGKGSVNISDFTAGNHTITVVTPENGNYSSLSNTTTVTVDKATSELSIEFSEIVPGENVTVTVNVGPNATNYVVITVNGEEHTVKVDENGTAVYVIENAKPGDLNITAEFLGDSNYEPVVKSSNTTVPKFTPEIEILEPVVDNNNSVTVVVKVEPADATGEVTVTLANGTNVSAPVKDGIAEIPVGVLPVNGTMAYNVTYSGDENYAEVHEVSDTNLTVGKLNNLTVDVNITPGKYGENTTVVVKVPEGAGGNVTVLVDGDEYPVELIDGEYVAVIPPMNLGPHDVIVKVENSSYYEDSEFTESFTVERNDDYDVIVNVTEGKFGENTTIEITAPKEIGNVTVTIDGVNYTVTINETTGKGVFNISNLTAGKHEVVTSFPGDEYFGPVSITNVIDVPKAESEMLVEVTGGEPGENVIIFVNVGPNATGLVEIDINGEKHYVELEEDGTLTYVIENADPGDYNITATFTGDDNYARATSEEYNITVERYDAAVTQEVLVDTNNNVTVIIDIDPADATGDVTVALANGTNITVSVEGGKAVVNIGVMPVNSTMAYNITYTGDEKYNGQTIESDENITVGKLNNLTVDVNITPGKYGENTTVVVKVPEGAGGNVTVLVDGDEYPVELIDGEYVAVIPPMNLGPHDVIVKVENSSYYEDSEFTESFTVERNDDYDVIVNVTEGKFGENTTIEITAPKEIGNVTVTIDGVNYTVTINETTGKGVFNISNLTAGKHEVVTSFPGDEYFGPVSTTNVIDVPKAESEMFVEVAGGEPGEDVTIFVNVGPNATGLVEIDINGEKHYVELEEDGTLTYVIENADPGDYNITATFTGDDNYARATSEEHNITVERYDATVTQEVLVDTNNNVTVIIDIDPADATGDVTVTLANGTNITVPVEGGKAVVNIGVMPVNSTMAYNITYTGDEKYNGQTIESDENITVGKLNNFTAEIEVIPGQYGENTTVKVTVPEDAQGEITVLVDGNEYPAVQENGTWIAEIPSTVGNHNVTVKYTNDPNYEDKEFNESYGVGANDHYDIKINVTEGDFGEDTIIDVEVPEGFDEVTVTIDGVNYTVPVNSTTGKGRLTIDNLTAGNHTVTVNVPENENYTSGSKTTTITVPKATSDMKINITGGEPGEDMVVSVDVGPNATGNVVVTVNGEQHVIPVDEDGKATYTIPDAQPGDYNITAEFLGDDNYAPVKNVRNITVPKFPSSIEVSDPIVSEDNNVTVVVKVDPAQATGTVTVEIDGETYSGEVVNGTAMVNVGIIPPNTAPVMNITYSGDDSFEGYEIEGFDSMEIGKLNNFTAEIEVIPGQYGENTTVIVTVPEDATGDILVVVDGVEYPAVQDENGTWIAEIPSTVGNHNVTVKYENDTRYADKEFNESYGVEPNDKYDVNITVTPVPPQYGEDITITVDAPEGIDEITVTVDGKNFTVPVNSTTGKGELVIGNLTGGDHEIIANIPGSENYAPKSNRTTFTVEPAVPEANVEVIPGRVGEPSKVNITLPEDAGGYIIIDVNGTKYYQEVVNGSAIVEIPELGYGDHEVNITYVGDGNYAPFTTEDTISVDKNPVEMNISVSSPEVGENTVVTVELPEDVYGTVTIQVGDITTTVAVTGGENEIIIPDVPVGEYDVVVTFNDNDKFASVNETAKLTVAPKQTTPDDFSIVDLGNGTVIITVPENATGNLTIIIDGEEFVSNITNGTATFDLSNITDLTPGVHNATIIYSGDANHTGVSYNTTITVPKLPSQVTAQTRTIREGDDENVVIEINRPDAKGMVLVDIEGVGYYANVTDGKATVTVPNLKQGEYTASVTYLGDNNYTESSTTASITVEAPITIDIDGSGNSSEIVIEVPANSTGNITVLIDDGEYAAIVDASGTVRVPLENITPGAHNVTVKYVDTAGTESVVNSVLIVPKWAAQIDAEAPVIRQGDNATVTVKVTPSDATGYVHIDIGGVGYYLNLTDGVGELTVSGLSEGTYDINATYLGDDFYEMANTTARLIVQAPIRVDIDVSGNSTQIVIEVPGNGTVEVEIDGEPRNVTVVNGTAVVDIDDLAPGKHNLTVTYTDENGGKSVVSEIIDVPKKDAPMDVEMKYDQGSDTTSIDVTLPEDATGVVLIDVDGTGYYVNVTDGKAHLDIPGLSEGLHNITASYLGDDKYNEASKSDTIDTTKKAIATMIVVDAKFSRLANDFNAGERGAMFYAVLMDTDGNLLANKKVQIAVNGPIYNVTTDEYGRAGLQVNLANANTYTYALFFQGDEKYKASHIASSKLTVTKKAVSIDAKDASIKASAKTKTVSVTLKVSKNPYDGKTYLSAGKKVTLTVAGVTYTAKADAKGVAKFNIDITKKGSYTAKIKFAGDKTYAAASKSVKIVIN